MAETQTAAPTLPLRHRIVKDEVPGLGSVYRVVGLPMFAEHQRTWNGESFDVDAPFLADLASDMKARAAEGWRPAIHAEHNSPLGGPRKRLAFADAPYVAPGTLGGAVKNVLFFDALCETLEDAKELERRPYRSPEVNLKNRTVESVAAMESEAPWFKFPITRFEAPAGEPALAGVAVGYRAAAETDDLRGYAYDAQAAHYSALTRFPLATYADEDEDEDARPESAQPTDAADYAEDEEDMEAVNALADKLVAVLVPKLQAAMTMTAPNAPAAMAPTAAPVVMARGEAPATYSAADVDAKLLAFEAKQSALYGAAVARLDATEKASKTEGAIAWARNETRTVVRPADFDAKVATYAAANPNTTDANGPLAIYVGTLKNLAQPNPAEIHADEPRVQPTDSAAVAAAIEKDARSAAYAREAAALYAALQPSMRAAIPEDKFIAGHLASRSRVASYAARN